MSLADGDDGALVVVFLQVNHALDSPVNSQSALQHQPAVHLPRLHFKAFAVVELIVSPELGFDLSQRDIRAGSAFCHRRCFLAEAFVRFHSCSMAEELRTEERTVTRYMAVRDLKSSAHVNHFRMLLNDDFYLRLCAPRVDRDSVVCRIHGTAGIPGASRIPETVGAQLKAKKLN